MKTLLILLLLTGAGMYQTYAQVNNNKVVKSSSALTANQSNAEPLGFKLGVTSLAVIKQKDGEMQLDGYSKWTGGKQFTSKGTVHNIEGAKNITYIFNKQDLLDAVIIVMHKDYFNKVNSYLKSKYKLQSETIPFVGDKYTKYKQGNSIVELNAPHLSFEMEVSYSTVTFDTAFKNKKLVEANNKTAEQKSKF